MEAAKNILVLAKSFKNLYSLRRVPAFVPYMIMAAELAELMQESISHHGRYAGEGAEYLIELAPWHLSAQRSISICNFFREGWGVNSSPVLPRAIKGPRPIVKNDKDGKPWIAHPHSRTFFRPDADLERFHDWEPDPKEQRDLSAGKPNFCPFPLQRDPLKKILDEDHQNISQDHSEGWKTQLAACGFSEMPSYTLVVN